MKLPCLLLMLLVSSCTVSADMIQNKALYCSGVYKGIRAVGRVATEVTTGISVPDVCDTIDGIVAEENADATTKSSAESGSVN
jgi:hypothetical protein